jgi:hypothetical protein
MQMGRNGEQLGTFEPERSNALEQMVENVHTSITKDFVQIRADFSSYFNFI